MIFFVAATDFLLPLPMPAKAGILVFLLFLYYLFRRKANKQRQRLPPEAGGAWPLIGHLHLLAGPKPAHLTLADMADKHGPIFTLKLGVHLAVVVSSPEIAKECFTTNDRVFANRPKALGMELLGYNYGMIGFIPYGPHWRQLKKITTLELLSNHRLEMLKHVRISEVKESVKVLYNLWIKNKDSSNKVLVDMKRWFGDITLNLIFRVIVGKRPYGKHEISDEDEKNKRCREALREFFELTGKFVVSDALPFLRWLDLGGIEKAMKKTAGELDEVVEGWLEEHKQKKRDNFVEQDFMDIMLNILDDVDELPEDQNADTINKATCLSLILAGSDTTSATLTWALSLLLNKPNILNKAQQELDIHVGRERPVHESDIKNLVYLQAIIKETMRLYPSVPLSLRHESMEDCITAGYRIPARTQIIFNFPRIHRDPNMWSDPCEFMPERFLTTHKHVDVRGQNFELIPFGSGRRVCPGISFALQVMQLTLATVLHKFEIGTQSNEVVDMVEGCGLTNVRPTPLEVFLTPRLPTNLYDLSEN